MWNDLNLKNPVHDICEYGNKDVIILQELPELVRCLTTSAELLTENHPIWDEIQIFKNIQAKYKKILHCDKCLQLLQRVGGCVKKMVLLNLSKTYLDLGEKILKELQKPNSSSYFLPSQQQLEYVLIRTQSAAKLICEALHYSRETFCYLIQKLKVGHLILNLMMATSVTARLNIVFKGLLVQLFDFYKKIYPWRKRLRKGGWEWSKTLELPADLESWINLKESEQMKPKHLPKDQLDFLSSLFDENNQGDVSSLADDDVLILDAPETIENNETNEENDCVIVESATSDDDIDNGVPIARSELESNSTCIQNSQPSSSSTPQRKRKNNKKLMNTKTSTSPTPQKKERSNVKLTKAQKTLLEKIRGAEDMKTLKIIWNNLDITNKVLLPKSLTAEKIRLIDKMFLQLKRGVAQVKKSELSDSEKEAQTNFLVKAACIRFAKHLKILPDKKVKPQKNINNVKLKPVRTCQGLKELYETIYQRLQLAQNYETCSQLKKMYKRRKADIKLLIENEEKSTAEQLILSSSKFFLAKFVK